MRLAGACTREAANAYLETEFLPAWEQRCTAPRANSTDAHRPLTELHNVAASLSHVEMRTVASDYTIQFEGKRYQIAKATIRAGLKGRQVRVEQRLDGTIAVRWEDKYLEIAASMSRAVEPKPAADAQPRPRDHYRGGRSRWMRDYPIQSAPPLWRAIRDSNQNC